MPHFDAMTFEVDPCMFHINLMREEENNYEVKTHMSEVIQLTEKLTIITTKYKTKRVTPLQFCKVLLIC